MARKKTHGPKKARHPLKAAIEKNVGRDDRPISEWHKDLLEVEDQKGKKLHEPTKQDVPQFLADAGEVIWHSQHISAEIEKTKNRIERLNSDLRRNPHADAIKDDLEFHRRELEKLQARQKSYDLMGRIRRISAARSSAAESHPSTASGATGKVLSFLFECNKLDVPRKVLKKDIWRSVGHRQPRQFQRWQKGQGTKSDEQNFSRIMAMKPEDFVANLKTKKILP